MKMIITIAWRNIWRQPGRSLVLLAAIISGVWAGVVVAAWANGLVEQRLNNLIETEITHAQVHHPEYLAERETAMLIEQPEEVMQFLQEDNRIRIVAGRTLAEGMLQSPVTTSGVRIRGIEPQQEGRLTNMIDHVVEGSWLDVDTRNPVLIGTRLAERHNIGIGNRIVLNFQDVNYELTSASFNIVGMYRTASAGYDERNVFVKQSDLAALIADEDETVLHEVAMMLTDPEEAEAVMADFEAAFPELSGQTWFELSPELRYMTDFGDMMLTIVMTIIMLALIFGILNTMLMSLFERMRELGMLLAIGMSKGRVFMMIMCESVMLTLTGALMGLVLAFVSVLILQNQGIDLTMFAEGLAEWGFDPIIYPVMTPMHYVEVMIIVILASLLAALYPAFKAIRLNPVEVQ